MSVTKYRKKPVVIEAAQFDGSPASGEAIASWISDNGGQASFQRYQPATGDKYDDDYVPMSFSHVLIRTLEGDMSGTQGDFIIKGVQGEFYPCKPDIFEKTYDTVD